MNISLPDPLKEFVDHQIADGRYSSVSEYIRDLIRNDEKRKAEERAVARRAGGRRERTDPLGLRRHP
jgi:antitoxin ParD1/3/4